MFDKLYEQWEEYYSNRVAENNHLKHILFHTMIGGCLSTKYLSNGKLNSLRIHTIITQRSGCLADNTRIKLTDGSFKSLKRLPIQFEVVGHNFQTGEDEICSAIKIDSGEKELFQIKLYDGRTVKASEDHIFFVRRDGQIQEVRVKDLKLTDELVVDKKRELSDKEIKTRQIRSKSNHNRWLNETWREHELKNRHKLVENGSYKLRRQRSAQTILKRYGTTSMNQIMSHEKMVKEKKRKSEHMLKNNPMFNPVYREKVRQSKGHKFNGLTCPKCNKIHVDQTGEYNHSFGIPRYPKKYFIAELGHIVRSSWEKNILVQLKQNNILYNYEPCYFKLSVDDKIVSYTPDAQILNTNIFLEIKGPVYNWQVKKMVAFKNQYPQYQLILISDKSMFERLKDFQCFDVNKIEELIYFLKNRGDNNGLH